MNAWQFVITAYALTLAGTAGLVAWAWSSMRSAEALTDSLKRER